MSKKTKSFTVDEDVAEELSVRDEVNASAVVNNYLREFLDATDRTETEVIVEEINRQIRDIDEQMDDLEAKRDRLVDRRERVKERDEPGNVTDEQRREILEKVRMVPKEEDHPVVENAAEELGLPPTEVIEEAYDR